MTIPRIYNPGELGDKISTELGKEYVAYIIDVLRLRNGDELTLFDGTGHEYRTIIRDCDSRTVYLDIIGKEKIQLPATHITLAQSLPKGSKMDFIVQKSTELGTSRIIPFISSRSIPRLKGAKAEGKAERWRKIAVEASRQSGRGDVPVVDEIVPFDRMLSMPDANSLRILLWEAEPKLGIKEILTDERYSGADSFFIVIGPEGGFSWEEIEKARQSGFTSVSLGKLIMRTETAPLAILSILQYEKGVFGAPAHITGQKETAK